MIYLPIAIITTTIKTLTHYMLHIRVKTITHDTIYITISRTPYHIFHNYNIDYIKIARLVKTYIDSTKNNS